MTFDEMTNDGETQEETTDTGNGAEETSTDTGNDSEETTEEAA